MPIPNFNPLMLAATLGLLAACNKPVDPIPPPPTPQASATSTPASQQPESARVRLVWQSEMEENTFGFYIYRADSPDAELVCINPDNPLPAAGTTHVSQEYVYYDLGVELGQTYYYRVKSVDLDGAEQWALGDGEPAAGRGKPLTAEEVTEIAQAGSMFRRPAPPIQDQ